MKLKVLLPFFTCLIILNCLNAVLIHAQSCLPDGITFDDQSEINSFQSDYPGCTIIGGNVLIKGNVNNLEGLNVLTEIQGRLRFYSLENLENMEGLNNLETIGGDLDIYNWPGSATSLTRLTGLEKLTSVGGSLNITGNSELLSLQGLDNLVTVGDGMIISGSNILENLSGLEKLSSIAEDVYIGENAGLLSLKGLESLQTIGGALEISICPALPDLNGLDGLENIGSYLKINTCDGLKSLSGLENLNLIAGGYFEIWRNDALESLVGLEKLEASSIEKLFIVENPMLSFCAVAPICNYIALEDADITISDNAEGCNSLEEVENACNSTGLDMQFIDDNIYIYPNPALDNLNIEVLKASRIKIQIISVNGQVVFETEMNEQEKQLDISEMKVGLYLIRISSDNMVTTEKLIKL